MFGDKSVHMARPQWGSLMVRLLFPIKQEGTMAEATQETELDAELKQLRDFTSEHSVDVVHAWLKEKSKAPLPFISNRTFAFGSSEPYTKYSTIRPSFSWTNLPPSFTIFFTSISPGAAPQHLQQQPLPGNFGCGARSSDRAIPAISGGGFISPTLALALMLF